jgi:hypothetical protein
MTNNAREWLACAIWFSAGSIWAFDVMLILLFAGVL